MRDANPQGTPRVQAPLAGVSLAEAIDVQTAPAADALIVPAGGDNVRCVACAHRCLLRAGRRGVCQVRYRPAAAGEPVRVPWGYVGLVQVDPIEKKPFHHVLPGSTALTFGMLGCDLHCAYCQNWLTSQALRDEASGVRPHAITPEELVAMALRQGARTVAASFNEPLITAEWARAVFERAREAGLRTAFVSNGHATPEVIAYLAPVLDAYKVDLKTFDDRAYRRLGGTLAPVLRTIEDLVRRGVWVEVVTLLVPGVSAPDTPEREEQLREAAAFLAGVSPDLPWHVTAFHRDYKLREVAEPGADDLMRAVQIGQAAGLRYVYAGNRPGQVEGFESTRCPSCATPLIDRLGHEVRANRLVADGECPTCGTAIPGVWG